MLEESGAMEKKLPPRQSPVQSKNNGVVSEKKSDYTSNKNGRQRKFREPNNGGRSQEPSQPRPVQKSRAFSDKRPRQRGYLNDRQSEEVAEVDQYDNYIDSTKSRKGGTNANHLLQFYCPRGESGNYGTSRGGGRYAGNRQTPYRKTPAPRYSKEQFLQASCQFIVREDGTYTEQAIDPDALVNWDNVELVRTFSTEPEICPICMSVPYAGKITKCGHVYCWACILHHLLDREMEGQKTKCPVCPQIIAVDDLRSVQCREVPEYKVGDEIEMKLMRKSKGSVYVCPKTEWKDRDGKPHNINDGKITQYMKLLLASNDQVQREVIDLERAALDVSQLDAEEYETCYIDMARNFLNQREENLKMKIQIASLTDIERVHNEETPEDHAEEEETMSQPPSILCDQTENVTKYADAFEDEEENASPSSSLYESNTSALSNDAFLSEDGSGTENPDLLAQPTDGDDVRNVSVTEPRQRQDSENSLNLGSLPLPTGQEPGAPSVLTPEEAADHLELPEGGGGSVSQQRKSGRTKDTYYFYQASTGQHIYMHSLNAQCLTKEYGSLENSPDKITASIVAIERIFMTEDVRKRLRYLNHIPLTCEFHVVELKIKPPYISKETIRHFQPEFEKRRKIRQRKTREEKIRAKEQEIEHKKTFGIYPEVHIPLDNLTQFPSHLASAPSTAPERQLSVGSESPSELGSEEAAACSPRTESSLASSPRHRNDSTGSLTFADMMRSGNPNSSSTPVPVAWGRAAPRHPVASLTSSATMPELRSPAGRPFDEDEDGEFLPAPSIASSWLQGIERALDKHNSQSQTSVSLAAESPDSTPNGGKKKKKKKEKQLLFSTSMARKP